MSVTVYSLLHEELPRSPSYVSRHVPDPGPREVMQVTSPPSSTIDGFEMSTPQICPSWTC